MSLDISCWFTCCFWYEVVWRCGEIDNVSRLLSALNFMRERRFKVLRRPWYKNYESKRTPSFMWRRNWN